MIPRKGDVVGQFELRLSDLGRLGLTDGILDIKKYSLQRGEAGNRDLPHLWVYPGHVYEIGLGWVWNSTCTCGHRHLASGGDDKVNVVSGTLVRPSSNTDFQDEELIFKRNLSPDMSPKAGAFLTATKVKSTYCSARSQKFQVARRQSCSPPPRWRSSAGPGRGASTELGRIKKNEKENRARKISKTIGRARKSPWPLRYMREPIGLRRADPKLCGVMWDGQTRRNLTR